MQDSHLILVTVLAAIGVMSLACVTLYVSVTMLPNRPVTGLVTAVAISMTTAIICAVPLNQLWAAKRDGAQRAWTARSQHLQQLQLLLRRESESLDAIARALRKGEYFTLTADDARRAIWHDEALTADIERHFPEYFREREDLLRRVLEHDTDVGRIRQRVSASLLLGDATEPYRSDLIRALVNKCAGAGPGMSPTRSEEEYVRRYDQYRCAPDLSRASQSLLDRAEDLADEASIVSETARRDAEETVLHGSCTYAPEE